MRPATSCFRFTTPIGKRKLFKVHVYEGNDTDSTLECWIALRGEDPAEVEITGLDIDKTTFTGRDFFECLNKFRLLLDKSRRLLLCNGARIDVHPSAMSREMSAGRLAYIITLGSPTTNADLVDIIDPAPLEKVGTVKEQAEYYQKWKESLR